MHSCRRMASSIACCDPLDGTHGAEVDERADQAGARDRERSIGSARCRSLLSCATRPRSTPSDRRWRGVDDLGHALRAAVELPERGRRSDATRARPGLRRARRRSTAAARCTERRSTGARRVDESARRARDRDGAADGSSRARSSPDRGRRAPAHGSERSSVEEATDPSVCDVIERGSGADRPAAPMLAATPQSSASDLRQRPDRARTRGRAARSSANWRRCADGLRREIDAESVAGRSQVGQGEHAVGVGGLEADDHPPVARPSPGGSRPSRRARRRWRGTARRARRRRRRRARRRRRSARRRPRSRRRRRSRRG